MKSILRLALLLAAACSLLGSVRAADVSVQGILLTASNESGRSDGRLAPYEPTLRKILRFQSYQFVGDDSASLGIPASASLALGDGHSLELTTERADGRTVHLKARWTAGGRTLMNTGLVLRPGIPAVLGGPSTGHKDEVYAIILVGR